MGLHISTYFSDAIYLLLHRRLNEILPTCFSSSSLCVGKTDKPTSRNSYASRLYVFRFPNIHTKCTYIHISFSNKSIQDTTNLTKYELMTFISRIFSLCHRHKVIFVATIPQTDVLIRNNCSLIAALYQCLFWYLPPDYLKSSGKQAA